MFYKNFKPIGFVETLVLNSSQGLLKNFRLSKFKKNNAKTNVISEIHSLNGLLLHDTVFEEHRSSKMK